MTECPTEVDLLASVMGDAVDTPRKTHIASCAVCQQRVSSLNAQVRAVQRVDIEHLSSSTPVLHTPRKIDGHLVLKTLGQGGQANAFLAWHSRLQKEVVIKRYHHRVSESDAESVSGNRLGLCTVRHPNLCQIYDLGVDEGHPYQVMEYLPCRKLQQWIQACRPNLITIIKTLIGVARAVDAVHQKGALHLDIKPDNILIDDHGVPRVIDFGMVPQFDGFSRSVTVSPGTPEYMAPEQLADDFSRVGVASDVYGIGAVLYAVMAQQPVRSVPGNALEPDWTRIRKYPRELQRICRKSLSVRPEERHSSAEDFAKDLHRFLVRYHRVSQSVAALAWALGIAILVTAITVRVPMGRYATAPISSDSTPDHLWDRSSNRSVPENQAWLLATSNCPLTPITCVDPSHTPEWSHTPASCKTRLDWSPFQDSWISSENNHAILLVTCQMAGNPHINDELPKLLGELEQQRLPQSVDVEINANGVIWRNGVNSMSAEEQAPLHRLLERIHQELVSEYPQFKGYLRVPANSEKRSARPSFVLESLLSPFSGT